MTLAYHLIIFPPFYRSTRQLTPEEIGLFYTVVTAEEEFSVIDVKRITKTYENGRRITYKVGCFVSSSTSEDDAPDVHAIGRISELFVHASKHYAQLAIFHLQKMYMVFFVQ